MKNKKEKLNKKVSPIIDTTVGLLSLSSKGVVDALILDSLVRPQEVDLPLKAGGLVLVKGQTLTSWALYLDENVVGAVDQRLDEILPIDRLEVSTI